MEEVIEHTLEFRTITYPTVYPNMYAINEYGVIKKLFKEYEFVKQTLTKSHKESNYSFVSVHLKSVDGKYHPYRLSRLVAWEFCLENRNIDLTVDHVDMITTNNHCSNLEWVSGFENAKRAYYNGHLNCDTTIKQEDQIRDLCQILQDNPTISAVDACRLANINIDKFRAKHLCNHLTNQNRWVYISSNYDMSKRKEYFSQFSSNIRYPKWDEELKNSIKEFIYNNIEITEQYVADKFFPEWRTMERTEKDIIYNRIHDMRRRAREKLNWNK